MRALAVATLVACLAPAARADDADPAARADALLDEATRLFTEEADHEGARRLFQDSHVLRPSWKALNGVALTYQEQGRFLEAIATYERLAQEFALTLTEGQRGTVKRRMDDLLARIGVLDVDAAQPGAQVSIDGNPAGFGPLRASVRVLPGPHVVVATLAGHEPFTQAVALAAGERKQLRVELTALAERVRVVVEKPRARFERRFPAWVPWAVLAGGGALLAGGGALTLAAAAEFAAFDDMVAAGAGNPPLARPVDDGGRETAELESTLGGVFLVTGGAAIATGLILLLVNQPRYVGESPVMLAPSPGGITLVTCF